MSNISRRKFLKGAGVAALAVAAAGVLAGCSQDNVPDVPGTDVPDIPQVTSETIDIYLMEVGGAMVGGVKTMTVLKGAKVVKVTDIPTDIFPEGYGIYTEDETLEIRDNGTGNRFISVPVKKATINDADDKDTGKKTLKTVKIQLQGASTESISIDVTIGDTITAKDVEPFLTAKGLKIAMPNWASQVTLNATQEYYEIAGFVVVEKL